MTSPHISLRIAQLFFLALFLVTLTLGIFIFANHERLFGKDPNVPSDGASARTYNLMQAFAVWAHVVALTGGFALGLH